MKVGDKIKIFPDTDIVAYTMMLHDLGFACKKSKDHIILVGRIRMDIDKNEVARTIRHYRKRAKMSQKQLAEAVGVGIETVMNWEVGVSLPSKFNEEMLKQVIGWECDEMKKRTGKGR